MSRRADRAFGHIFTGSLGFLAGALVTGILLMSQRPVSSDIVVPVVNGVVLKASHRAPEAQMAFNGAADRIEKQLRRYGKRLKERRADESDQALRENAGYTIFTGVPSEDSEPAAPAIIAETRVDIPEASVSDAVMMLDLRDTNALLFRNSGTGNYNMVYRRGDGTIGWVEPQRAA